MNEEKDPCFKENKASLKCLNDNDYDYSKCNAFFANYKECKTFWMQVKSFSMSKCFQNSILVNFRSNSSEDKPEYRQLCLI